MNKSVVLDPGPRSPYVAIRRAWPVAAVLTLAGLVCGQGIAPVEGIRSADLRTHAIVGATVVTEPGTRIEDATIVIRDGVIAAVGADVEAPPGARVWPGEGLTVYPGLIDAAVMIDVAAPDRGVGSHWNERVHPEIEMAAQLRPAADVRKSLRDLGFTAAAFYPGDGLFRGTGAVLGLSEEDEHVVVYHPRAAMAAAFDYGGSWQEANYPGSLMGAIALMRQTLYDARWHRACVEVWQADPAGHEPPAPAEALEALGEVVQGRQGLLFEVSDELNAMRAMRVADEFGLDVTLLGSGTEFRRLDEIARSGAAVVCPLAFPDRPGVSSLAEADDVSLRTLQTWEQAPTNPRRLADAGVTVALTTHRLDRRGDFAGAVSSAVRHGLDADRALAMLTTVPARLLGVDDVMGTIEAGKVANLAVVKGDLFARKPTIRDTWINGRRHQVSADPSIQMKGKARLATDTGAEADLTIDTAARKITVKHGEKATIKAIDVEVEHDRVAFVLDGRPFGAEGYVRLTGLIIDGRLEGTGALPGGDTFGFTITPVEAASGDAGDDEGGKDGGRRRGGDKDFQMPPDDLVQPLGAFGFASIPRPETVAFFGATIWTSGPDGIVEDGALLIRGGRIAWVGRASDFDAPADARVIDATGRHISPGLIDCHSHTGIDGGVNEWTNASTAEVRIRDVIDPDDINWYRQLAGGLTACNQLHGSANPIGGQNSVVKLRWSQGAAAFPVAGAIEGIKFALGENVKRTRSRYPNTRMGVETFIRDRFTAAEAYRDQWRRYQGLGRAERARTMPPRRNLELDALVEILEGERLVHCHSYRQDEILMLIRVAEAFGFQIGTFQHVLEGYKVAEAIAAHGAGASTFSDWWAYKVEVMDAIPFNGALMHDVGVLVTFNSDSSELARRMNAEAAKAVRYGGVDPHEALGFVTINAAKQLRIDHRTGSLEQGKDADLAVWTESPLSTYARCEQTWIDGARYFDLETDRELRARVAAERQRLIQKVLAQAHGKPTSPGDDDGEDGDEDDKDKDADPDKVTEEAEPERPYSCCWSHDR